EIEQDAVARGVEGGGHDAMRLGAAEGRHGDERARLDEPLDERDLARREPRAGFCCHAKRTLGSAISPNLSASGATAGCGCAAASRNARKREREALAGRPSVAPPAGATGSKRLMPHAL